MKKTYYLFNPGRLSRKDNTLKFIAVDEEGQEQSARYIPIEGISDLYIFGALEANSALYNFLGKNRIAVHFFDYYENYTGSFMPREYLLAGRVLIAQSQHYTDEEKRLFIARQFIEAASHNILKNLRYYQSRCKDLEAEIAAIETHREAIFQIERVAELMGVEGNIRQIYYQAFNTIISDFEMPGRSKQPPLDEVNALISFGNMMCYSTCLRQIYHTQLNPTISFLHQPGERRYSLALDLAEIFKPILVDRVIFKVLNKRMINAADFDQNLNRCYLKDSGKKVFIKAYEERLNETIQHRVLKKKVSYGHLIKLECFKLVKHILGEQNYKALKIWW
ncbi:MAG: type I-B CRISPR-associated endonuclease Cas1b [Calditrichia bacterium]